MEQVNTTVALTCVHQQIKREREERERESGEEKEKAMTFVERYPKVRKQ